MEHSNLPPSVSGSIWNRFKRQLASSFNFQQVLSVDRFGAFRFYASSPTEVFRTMDYGGEPLMLGAFLFLLKPTDIVWDIGASIGLFSVHSAAHASAVVAFEPDPATRKRCHANAILNHVDTKIRIESCALGDNIGEFELHTDGLNGNAPSLKPLRRHSNVVKIPVKTIDSLILNGLPAPTVMKIDIEGAELIALRGASNLLTSPSAPRLIFVEVHPVFLKDYEANPNDVLGLLRSAGYYLTAVNPEHDQLLVVATKNNN